MKVAVGLRRVAAGKRTSGRRAAQIAADIDILKIMLKKDTKKKLIEEIRKLNDIYKEVLELKYIAQFSNQEIADFLHIEKKTVEMRLYRANNILRERLRDWYYEN